MLFRSLNPLATSHLIEDLERAKLPQNRTFLYDTFRANCATKILDLVNTHTAGALQAQLAHTKVDGTFRDDVRQAYSKRLTYLLATELVAGIELDRPRTQWALSYRPAHM